MSYDAELEAHTCSCQQWQEKTIMMNASFRKLQANVLGIFQTNYRCALVDDSIYDIVVKPSRQGRQSGQLRTCGIRSYNQGKKIKVEGVVDYGHNRRTYKEPS